MHFIAQILLGTFTYLVLFLWSNQVIVLGFWCFAALVTTGRLPLVGGILINALKLSFLFKLFGILVAGSGVILPLILVQALFPHLLEQRGVLWGVLAAATWGTLRIMHSAHLMDFPDFHSLLPMHRRIFGSEMDERSVMRLMRMQFADITITNVFTLVGNFGVSAFCLYKLDLITTTGQGSLTPLQGIEEALSILKIAGVHSLDLTGGLAILLNVFYGLSLLYYMVFFLSLRSQMIDTTHKDEEAFDAPLLEQWISVILGKPPNTLHKKEATVAQATSLKGEGEVGSDRVSDQAGATTSETATGGSRN